MAGTQLNNASTDYHRHVQQSSDPSAPAATFWNLYFRSTGLFVQAPSSALRYYVGGLRHEIMVYAKDMRPSLTAGCAALAQTETATNDQNFLTLDFDNVTQEHAEFDVVFPDSWQSSQDLTAQFYWMATGGSALETVSWALQAYAYTDGSALDQSWGTATVTSDALGSTDTLRRSAESTNVDPASSQAGGRLIHFRVYRDVAADNLAADAKLIAIRLFYY